MADVVATLTSTLTLLGTASFMIVVSLVFTSLIPPKLSAPKKKMLVQAAIGVVLGVLAIFGTLMGTKLANGTIINVRELAAMIAGMAGGPIGGIIAGLMGGLHRYTVGGTTALPCTVSTILIGIVAGLISTRISGRLYLVKGAVTGFVLESAAMGLILLLVQPLSKAVSIVDQIAVPMISADTIGLVLWLYLANRLRLQRQARAF
jgi:LytS/YehU family sensor histidine kinase